MNKLNTYIQIKYYDDDRLPHIAFISDSKYLEFYKDRFGEVIVLSTKTYVPDYIVTD